MPREHQQWLAESAAKRLNHEPMMVDRTTSDFATHYLAAMTMPSENRKEQMDTWLNEYAAAYGHVAPREKPFVFHNGLAVIPVHGALINRFPYAFSFATGYNFIRSQMRAALEDDEVVGIVFDIDSGGGEAAGCMELAEEIREAREIKPSMAVVDSYCCSAAYAVGSAASSITVTQSSTSGSIGVVAMHISIAKMLEEAGIEVTFLWAGEDKKEGNFFEQLSDKAKRQIQARIDLRYEEFVSLVAKNRSLGEDSIRDTKARTFAAAEAVDLGLVDEIAMPSAAIAQFYDSLTGPPPNEDDDEMTTPNAKGEKQNQGGAPSAQQPAAEAPAAAPAAAPDAAAGPSGADIKAAERTRISSITASEAGKANPGLANHLAFNTDMSAEAADEVLKAAGPSAQAQAEQAAGGDGGIDLDTAMQKTGGGANVPADQKAEGTGDEPNPDRADYAALMGAMGMKTETQK